MSHGMRRLCIVNPALGGGGAEFQIKCLLDMLPSRRYEIFYLTRLISGKGHAAGCSIVPIGPNQPPRFGYLMDAVPLYRALRAIAPHAIYQRVASGYTGVCAYYARRKSVPMIWHVASDSDVTPKTQAEGRNPVRPYLEKISVEYAIPRADHIVVQKEEQGRLLKQHYGREPNLLVRNFHPEPTERIDKSGQLTVVWVANLKRLKQPEMFVRLAQALRDLGSVKFVMVGAPPAGSGDREWGEALMREIKATPNLEYVGVTSHDGVNELIARAHLFVNTSWYEGFPNTFIQSWMREVPVVSLNVDPDGLLAREGIGVRAASETDLIDTVRLFLTDRARRDEYGFRARAYANERHSTRNALPLVRLIEDCTEAGAR